jgi:DNA processing protein
VLASGVDLITPASNRSLAGEILEHGGFLASEYSPGVPPQKYHFPARNRIISGLARGVVVVQAPIRSGALITAEYALDQGRDLFVHSSGLDGPTGAGTADLASDGAPVISSADEVFRDWGVEIAAGHSPRRTTLLSGSGDASNSREAASERVEALRVILGAGRMHGLADGSESREVAG